MFSAFRCYPVTAARDMSYHCAQRGPEEVTMSEFNAIWPGGESAVPPVPAAPRTGTLEGKCIAFLWDSMFRGDEVFPLLERDLKAQYPGVTFVGHDAFGSTFGGDEHAVLDALPERLTELGIDAVVSGIGA